MYGGDIGTAYFDDLWERDSGATVRPAELMHVACAAAGAPDDASLTSVSAAFRAGGEAFPAGVQTPGSALLMWDEGRWRALKSNAGDLSTMAALEWGSTDSGELKRLLYSPKAVLHFAVTPAQDSGAKYGHVSVDYAEVTVAYRKP